MNVDLYRCFNVWTRNLRRDFGTKGIMIYKIDCKVDSKGTFCISNYESHNGKMVRALGKACSKITELDSRYLDHQDEWVYNVQTEDEEFKAIKGFQQCHTFITASIIAQGAVHYSWKRYHKESEMIQKGTVGDSVSTRVGKLVGINPYQKSEDGTFLKRILRAKETGITRDEIGVWAITGLLTKLDGRTYDLDEAQRFVSNIVQRLNILRAPTLTKRMLELSVWKIPTNDLLTRFAAMPTNLVVIGDKRLTFAYARHEIKSYTTGCNTGIFVWQNLLSFLEDGIKKYATIGAKIHIYHHNEGYIGTVRKLKKQNSFFVPIGVTNLNAGFRLPVNWNIAPSEDQLSLVIIEGWQAVEAKLLKMFKREKPQKKINQWVRNGFSKGK